MKIRVDDIVHNEVTKSGKSKTQIAKDLKVSRTGLLKILEKDEMEMKYVIAIGKSIRFDFAEIFPELNTGIVSEIVSGNGFLENANVMELRLQLLDIQQKYIKLLEQHVAMLHQLKTQ